MRQAVAEDLPFADESFDAALASLVVGFMQDPIAGVREMCRVTVEGGTVATCFWDRTRMPALGLFWEAARSVDPSIEGEAPRRGTVQGDLRDLLLEAGLADVADGTIDASADYADFDDLWSVYTLRVGPIGLYYQSLDEPQRDRLREKCRERLGNPTRRFTLSATAWFARGTVDRARA